MKIMGAQKKIFFSYSSQTEDLELYKKIYKHFAAYSSIGLYIIDKNEIFKLTGDKSKINDLLKTADITIPLLSIDYINDEDCLKQLEYATDDNKVIVPILLRDFDWEAFTRITQYKQHMLPDDLTSVETHISSSNNNNNVFKEIAQHVRAIIFPELKDLVIQKQSHVFYYTVASAILLIGILTAWYIYDKIGDNRIVIITILMSVVIAMFALKNALFPNKINIIK